MAISDDKLVGSNDEQMWTDYHTRSVWSPTGALNALKTTVVCRMFASRILGMSGPISSALELGCGTASTLATLARRTGARAVGIDRSPAAVAQARARYPRIDVQVGDLFDLQLPPKSFDLVYSVGLFEHFARAEQLRLLEVHAALATKYVCMMVPADGILMNSILYFNKRILGRSGTWADEEVFSARLLARYFPGYTFDVDVDRRFGNLILWFGWRP